MFIAEYIDLPRFGLQKAAQETVSGVGPCVELFANPKPSFSDGQQPRIAPHEGKRLFKECGSTIKFLLTVRPNYFLALGTYSLSVFRPFLIEGNDGNTRVCENDDEIIGHGKIAQLEFERKTLANDIVSEESVNFNIPIVLRSGEIRVLKINVEYKFFQKKFDMTVEIVDKIDNGTGKIVVAPLVDKTNFVLIYEDSVVHSSNKMSRGKATEGRRIVAAGETTWKNKVLLATDDGEIHIAKVSRKAIDSRVIVYDEAQLAVSSGSMRVDSPSAFALSSHAIVVGNKNGDIYYLDKKLQLIHKHEMKSGPITFMIVKKNVLWYGTETGALESTKIVYGTKAEEGPMIRLAHNLFPSPLKKFMMRRRDSEPDGDKTETHPHFVVLCEDGSLHTMILPEIQGYEPPWIQKKTDDRDETDTSDEDEEGSEEWESQMTKVGEKRIKKSGRNLRAKRAKKEIVMEEFEEEDENYPKGWKRLARAGTFNDMYVYDDGMWSACIAFNDHEAIGISGFDEIVSLRWKTTRKIVSAVASRSHFCVQTDDKYLVLHSLNCYNSPRSALVVQMDCEKVKHHHRDCSKKFSDEIITAIHGDWEVEKYEDAITLLGTKSGRLYKVSCDPYVSKSRELDEIIQEALDYNKDDEERGFGEYAVRMQHVEEVRNKGGNQQKESESKWALIFYAIVISGHLRL
ncbi:hypothetical protein PFISCL1PPCAC_14970 [Pristionchus fissidentatus]|uniref:Uncharacterized protein n=1 Tax=Pristionchus fissidentatus TaxID=1538716 RepID=A0AAV5VW87_9BILA|nr:hypothetical protein PFISCL1PPCAC_14970 [Pristionchus fissidentatus]